jgi:hypothetical protein
VRILKDASESCFQALSRNVSVGAEDSDSSLFGAATDLIGLGPPSHLITGF